MEREVERRMEEENGGTEESGEVMGSESETGRDWCGDGMNRRE